MAVKFKSNEIISSGEEVILDTIEVLSDSIRRQAATLSTQEVRFIVDNYYQNQENRKRGANQVRALTESGEPKDLTNFFASIENFAELKAKQMLQAYAEGNAISQWAMSIRGIGPVIAAGLAAHIDITKAPTAGAIWRFAGLDPTSEWKSKELRPWNAKLKTLAWKIGESFVKVQNHEEDIYGKVYAERKLLEIERNEAGLFADQAAIKATQVGKGTEAYKHYSKGKLSPGHIQSRAKRYAVKLFLAHYHHVAYKLHYGEEPPKPYVIDHLNHTHFIKPPNFE